MSSRNSVTDNPCWECAEYKALFDEYLAMCDENASQMDEIERLRAALEPFALLSAGSGPARNVCFAHPNCTLYPHCGCRPGEPRNPPATIEAALSQARAALVRCGFVGPGQHGSGDPEINAIDTALARCAPQLGG